jgi:hypothetical protein
MERHKSLWQCWSMTACLRECEHVRMYSTVPAASMAATKELGLCLVSSLHVRVSTITEK